MLGFGDLEQYSLLYLKNASLFAFTPIAVYFLYKRALPLRSSIPVLSIFPFMAILINLYPSYEPHHTAILTAVHLPIVLLSVLLYFYGGPSPLTRRGDQRTGTAAGWRSTNTRLNFVRFAGESFIYVILIGLGGLVLIFLTAGTFELIGLDAFPFITAWIAPFGFFGLFTMAAYLVGQKQSLIESIAPVLARIFTPLFLLVLLSLLTAFALTPNQAYENRSMLIWFDVILAIVLGLALYSMSAREIDDSFPPAADQSPDPLGPSRRRADAPRLWDLLTCALILSAVFVDIIALSGIIMRLSAYGFTPNRTAALGENILLLINLILLSLGYLRYILRGQPFRDILVMQMRILPIYPIWALIVIMLFPPFFAFR